MPKKINILITKISCLQVVILLEVTSFLSPFGGFCHHLGITTGRCHLCNNVHLVCQGEKMFENPWAASAQGPFQPILSRIRRWDLEHVIPGWNTGIISLWERTRGVRGRAVGVRLVEPSTRQHLPFVRHLSRLRDAAFTGTTSKCSRETGLVLDLSFQILYLSGNVELTLWEVGAPGSNDLFESLVLSLLGLSLLFGKMGMT